MAVLPSEPAPLYPRTASSHGPALTPDARSCDSLTETDLPFASGLVSDQRGMYAGPCDVLPLPGAPTGSSGRPVPLAYGEADASALITQAEVIAACVGKLRQLFARTDGPLPVPAPDGASGRRSGSGRTSLSGLVPDATYFDAQVGARAHRDMGRVGACGRSTRRSPHLFCPPLACAPRLTLTPSSYTLLSPSPLCHCLVTSTLPPTPPASAFLPLPSYLYPCNSTLI